MPVASNKRDYSKKRRIKAHVIEDLSVNHIEKFVFKKKYTVDCSFHDYGYDLSIETFTPRGLYEAGQIKVQVKAKVRPHYIKRGQLISFPCELKDLRVWCEEPYPVILVMYDVTKEKAHWLYIQNYVKRNRINLKKLRKATQQVHIPVRNVIDERAIELFKGYKNKNLQQARKEITYET